jgi:hypothetical protein
MITQSFISKKVCIFLFIEKTSRQCRFISKTIAMNTLMLLTLAASATATDPQ